MFKNNEFEIYKTLVKLKCEIEKMKKTNRQTLQMRETLKIIKKKYYQIIKYITD